MRTVVSALLEGTRRTALVGGCLLALGLPGALLVVAGFTATTVAVATGRSGRRLADMTRPAAPRQFGAAGTDAERLLMQLSAAAGVRSPRLRVATAPRFNRLVNAETLSGRRPVMVLSEPALRLPVAELSALLAHELAHVLRRDSQRVAAAVLLSAVAADLGLAVLVHAAGMSALLAAAVLYAAAASTLERLGLAAYLRRRERRADDVAVALTGPAAVRLLALLAADEPETRPGLGSLAAHARASHPSARARLERAYRAVA